MALGRLYPHVVAIKREQHPKSELPTPEAVEAARAALLAKHPTLDEAEVRRSRDEVLKALTGLSLGVTGTPSFYR